jgi:WD repeat-containing protein 23
VRDASWHPNAPMIVGTWSLSPSVESCIVTGVASAWSGYGMSTGTCTLHSWNDGAEEDEAEPKMGLRVNQKLEIDPSLYATPPRRARSPGRPRLLRGLRGWAPEEEDDDE